MRILTILLAVFSTGIILSGCKTPPDISLLSKSKRLGFISLLRDEFHGIHAGSTSFSSKSVYSDTPSWAINTLATNYILKQVKKNEHFSIYPAFFDKNALLRSFLKNRIALSRDGSFGKELWKIASEQGFDSIVILAPTTVNKTMFRYTSVGEYGLYHRNSSFSGNVACTFVKYELMVYSQRDKRIVGRRPTWSTRNEVTGKECSASDKNTGLPKSIVFKEDFSDYSRADRSLLKKHISAQFTANLKMDMECLKLKPMKDGKFRTSGCSFFDG